MSLENCVNAKMCQTDAASLCTLCVLETQANAFENFSSSLSPDTQIFNDNVIENDVTAGINYLSFHRESFNKIEENVKLDNKGIDSTKNQHERNENFQWKPTNHPDDGKNASQYPEKSIEHEKSLGQLSSQNKDQDKIQQPHHERSTILSSSGISRLSFEIGILPELSQTIIDQVLRLVDKNLIESTRKIGIPSKFDESSKEQPQVSILKPSSQTISKATNPEKVVSMVNPLLEPIQRLERMGALGMTLKRDKNDGAMEIAMEVPKKKPKIVTQEVLKLPVFRLPLGQAPAMQNFKENINNNIGGVDTKSGVPSLLPEKKVTKGLQILTNTGESERRLVHIRTELVNRTHSLAEGPQEKVRKVENKTRAEGKSVNGKETGKNFQNPSERDSPLLTKRFSPKYSDLSMLQRKLTENSQSLIKQAEEMKKLRESLTSEERSRAKKEFVSKSTQTIDSQPLTISANYAITSVPIVDNVQQSNVESSETNSRPIYQTETETFHRNWFPPVTLKLDKDATEQSVTGAQETAPKSPFEKDCPEKIAVEKSIDDKLFSVVENQETLNSTVQYDPYYNPLRPRRWPKNRYNPTKFGLKKQCHRKDFPPLPIVIDNKRSTNANKQLFKLVKP